MMRTNSVANDANAESAPAAKRVSILLPSEPSLSTNTSSLGASTRSSSCEGSPNSETRRTLSPNSASRPSLYEFLAFPQNKDGGKCFGDIATAAKRVRPAFLASAAEREIGRIAKNGKELSELEILQEKHEPEFKQLVPAVSEAISALLMRQPKVTLADPYFKAYETSSDPTLQLDEYIQRLAEYTYISPSTMVVALIYMDRMCSRYPNLVLTTRNVFKFVFVALRVASKANDLRSLNNKNFANVGGVSLRHLNELETKFILDLRFGLYVEPSEFGKYAERCKTVAPHHSVPRPLALTHSDSTVARRLATAISQDHNLTDRNSTGSGDSPHRPSK